MSTNNPNCKCNCQDLGQIYFLDEIDPRGPHSNYIKIGKISPNDKGRSSLDRLKEHQTGNPRQLNERYVLETLADVSKLESILHNSFSTRRIRDEWFITQKGNIDSFVEKAKEINIALEEEIPLNQSIKEFGSEEDKGEEKKSCSESEDLHNLIKNEEEIINDLNQRKKLIDYKLRLYGGTNLKGIEGISSYSLSASSTRFDERKFLADNQDLALQIGKNKVSGTFSLRKMPKKIKNNTLETLKENYDSKRKLSESFQMIERNSESEALHLEWLEIHKNIQPHELQKRSLLLRLKSLTGEYSGIENICSWKRRKKLKVSKSDLEIYNPSLVKNYLVNSQPVLKFNLNDFRPYKF